MTWIAAVPLVMGGRDLPVAMRAAKRVVAFVLVGLAFQRTAVGQPQIALGALERLDARLRVDRQDNGVLRGFRIRESCHPPLAALTYDTSKGGYVVDLDEQKLEGAPTYRMGEESRYDREYGRHAHDYYRLPYGGI